MSVAQAVDKLGALAGIGTDVVILLMPDDYEDAVYERVADLVRQVRPL
jgi:hypothetical protein